MKVYEKDSEYNFAGFGNADEIKFTVEYLNIIQHNERLQAACSEAYQVVGHMLLESHEQPKYTHQDVILVLDNLIAAVNNIPLPHSDVLPWPKSQY